MVGMEEGETYTGRVDRLSRSGNGVIEKQKCGPRISHGGHLIIPEADEDWVGDVVKFEYLGGHELRVISRGASLEEAKTNKSNPIGGRYLNNNNDLLGEHQ